MSESKVARLIEPREPLPEEWRKYVRPPANEPESGKGKWEEILKHTWPCSEEEAERFVELMYELRHDPAE